MSMIQKMNEYARIGISRIKRESIKHNIKESIITILLFITAVSIITFIMSAYSKPRVISSDIVPGYTSIYDMNKQPVTIRPFTFVCNTTFNDMFINKQDESKKLSSNIYRKKQNKTTNKVKKKSNNTIKRQTPKDTSSFKQFGVASHMGYNLQGRTQANGEKHDKNKLICAHRTLPFGTLIKVTNKSNGKSVNVVVTDRGPYVSGRVVDLSLAAAIKIGIKDAGVANVEVVKIR